MVNRIGIMVVNLGSPAQPTPKAVRKYLHQFLMDPHVIALSPLLWRPILHGIILRRRPARSAAAYQKIWNQTQNGDFTKEAPLIEITREQAAKLQKLLPDNVIVEPGMRYGEPSIKQAFDNLLTKGCNKVGILPLYPQYAGSTVASVYDELVKVIGKRNDLPSIRFLRDYHDNPSYIDAISQSLRTHLNGLDWRPDKILFSFHGLPVSNIERGDPYKKECQRTFELLRNNLSDVSVEMQITFQSRFGPKKWVEPYTSKTLESMAASGQKNVVIITPGFSSDSLETLEELNIKAKQLFLAHGGENFSCVPCLNAQDIHINALANITKKYLLKRWQSEANTDGKINIIGQPHN
ncbi:MAG: ferrochelatase [Robiginitomaculum sp.]